MIALLNLLSRVNTLLLRIGRQLAWMALVVMVAVILAQVFFRYVLNNALAWPDEAARFMMLWMTALMAPSALRWGGFVSIDIVPESLPRVPGLVLILILQLLSLVVLVAAIGHGYNHTFGFGGNFNSSSLRLPLDLIGMESVRVKLRYMYASLFVGVILMTLVCIEMILRSLVSLTGPNAQLPDDDRPQMRIEAD